MPKAHDAFRRNLQRGYLDTLAERLNGTARVNDDQRAFFRAELKNLSGELAAALARTTDASTRAHLDDSKDLIARILDPKVQWTAPAAASSSSPQRRGWEDGFCWQDYGIYSNQE